MLTKLNCKNTRRLKSVSRTVALIAELSFLKPSFNVFPYFLLCSKGMVERFLWHVFYENRRRRNAKKLKMKILSFWTAEIQKTKVTSLESSHYGTLKNVWFIGIRPRITKIIGVKGTRFCSAFSTDRGLEYNTLKEYCLM